LGPKVPKSLELLLGAGFVVSGFEGPTPPEEEEKKKINSR